MNEIISTRNYSELISKMGDKTYAIQRYYFRQYAPGITGQTKVFTYYTKEGGFKKREAQQWKNSNLNKPYVRKNEAMDIRIVSKEEMQEAINNSSFCYRDDSLFYGWWKH